MLMRLSQTERPRRGGGTRPTRAHERDVVSPLPSQWEGEPRGTLIGQRVKEGGESEGRSVMERIELPGVEIPNPKGCRLPPGRSSRES